MPKYSKNKSLQVDEDTLVLTKASLFAMLIVCFVVTWLCINNVLHGRYEIALGNIILVLIASYIGWQSYKNIYQPILIGIFLAPIASIVILISLKSLGLMSALWSFPLILGVFFVLKKDHAILSGLVCLLIVLVGAWLYLDISEFVRFAITIVTSYSLISVFKSIIARQHSKLQHAATVDPLTGLLNRTILNDVLNNAYDAFRERKLPMTMLIIDIDHFKTINDNFGHGVGDKVLAAIGEYFLKSFRPSDRIFRAGGEEFLVLLFDTKLDHAKNIAERITEGVKKLNLLDSHAVTISVGVTSLREKDDVDHWVLRGDQNLYMAKANGRDQVVA